MRVCILQPDYSTSDVDYKNYDPPRNLSHLLPGHEVDHVFLNKLHTYRQIKNLKKKNYDIYVNLCEAYLEWSVPSIDVIQTLDLLNLPYTGPNAELYDPPKELMKYVAYTCGISAPRYVVAENVADLKNAIATLQFPLFVKPAKAGDSLGIDEDSLVKNAGDLRRKVELLLQEFDDVIVEEYIPGREFTVLVTSRPVPGNWCDAYNPIEFIFPEGKQFKTYALKTSELHSEANVPCTDPELSAKLKDSATHLFKAFNGVGYARLDFRVKEDGSIFFLEINFTCSVFYEDGYEGSADYILINEPGGKKDFLKKIIDEGICRHLQKQKKYSVKGNALSGYGIYASRNISRNEIIFFGEEKPHRLVTKKYVEENWSPAGLQDFSKYAWPVSDQVYILWDRKPEDWAPQNHSCDPNTRYEGLNVIANANIKNGDELTLDYTSFLNNEMETFICNCGSANCKSIIRGKHQNSITHREKNRL